MLRAINIPIFTPAQYVGGGVPAVTWGDGENVSNSRVSPHKRGVAPRITGRVSPRHRGPRCHSISVQPHQQKHNNIYALNIFKATFLERPKYIFSSSTDCQYILSIYFPACQAATSSIQQFSLLYTERSLNHPNKS